MKLPWNKLAAELLGAGVLTFMVLISLAFNIPVSTPVIAGLTLGFFVYTIGGISGAHINPAVTIGLWSIKKITMNDAIAYVVAQTVGAFIAMTLFQVAFQSLPAVTADASVGVLLGEALGAAVLLFGISAVVYKKVSDGATGVVIGGALLLGILAAAPAANGVLNPAVAIGVGSASWAYLLGPILGAVLACQGYRWLAASK